MRRAYERVTSSREGEAGVTAVPERGDVLVDVQVVEDRLPPADGGAQGLLAALDGLGAVDRRGDLGLRTDDHPVVVADHQVSRTHLDVADRDRDLDQRGLRGGMRPR